MRSWEGGQSPGSVWFPRLAQAASPLDSPGLPACHPPAHVKEPDLLGAQASMTNPHSSALHSPRDTVYNQRGHGL